MSSFGRGVNRRYGLTTFIFGNSFSASSPLTLGWTITSSPSHQVSSPSITPNVYPPLPKSTEGMSCSPGTQLIGVVILCLSPVCKLSTTLKTSAVFLPVLAG